MVSLNIMMEEPRLWARIIEAYLGNRNASSGSLANVANLAAATANDAPNHVGGDANVLSLDFLSILVVGRRAASGSVGIRATAERS